MAQHAGLPRAFLNVNEPAALHIEQVARLDAAAGLVGNLYQLPVEQKVTRRLRALVVVGLF